MGLSRDSTSRWPRGATVYAQFCFRSGAKAFLLIPLELALHEIRQNMSFPNMPPLASGVHRNKGQIIDRGGQYLALIDSKRHMAIHRRGKRPPLFWVQAGLVQAKVLQELDREQPVYCLYRLRPDPNEQPLTLEEIAAYHIATMRSLCPQGPYALAGYCVCGAIVFEMARQLRAQGETISALILIDPLDANVTRADLVREPRLFRVGFQFYRVLFHLQKIRHYSAKEKWAYFTNSFKAIQERLKSSPATRQSDDVVSAPRTLPEHVLLDVHALDMYAVARYLPEPYEGSAIVLRPSFIPRHGHDYPNRRWAQLIQGGLDIQKTPGDSDSMWRLPDATGMARTIDACMGRIPSLLVSDSTI